MSVCINATGSGVQAASKTGKQGAGRSVARLDEHKHSADESQGIPEGLQGGLSADVPQPHRLVAAGGEQEEVVAPGQVKDVVLVATELLVRRWPHNGAGADRVAARR